MFLKNNSEGNIIIMMMIINNEVEEKLIKNLHTIKSKIYVNEHRKSTKFSFYILL